MALRQAFVLTIDTETHTSTVQTMDPEGNPSPLLPLDESETQSAIIMLAMLLDAVKGDKR